MFRRAGWFAAFAVATLLAATLLGTHPLHGEDATQPPTRMAEHLRRPVALVLADHGKWLLVANQRSSTISVLDTESVQPVAELSVGGRLADLAATPDQRHLLGVDEEGHRLVIVSRRGLELKILHKVPVSPFPVSVTVGPDGRRCFIASLWSRRLTIVDLNGLNDGPGAKLPVVVKIIELPFAPRMQLLMPGATKLAVTDAFGGQVAVVDMRRGEVDSVRALPAHNLRGLTLSADGTALLLAHQILNGHARTTIDDIHWGNLMMNCVRRIPIADVVNPNADLLRNSTLRQLGEPGRGGGDPAGIAAGADGTLIVALAGVGEVALGTERAAPWRRLAVGARPTAVALDPSKHRAYVANTFADSVSIVDVGEAKVETELALGPPPPINPSDRGEQLFHDARLSHQGWLSCHSCHTDGHTNGLLNDNQGDDSFGAPKRVLSLLGVRDTPPWAWNGLMPDLEGQIRKSIGSTMHGKDVEEQVYALTAFLQSLAPPPPLGRFAAKAEEGMLRHGRDLFKQLGCEHCHPPPDYTSAGSYHVGMVDEVGNSRFNPPSLLGVSQGGPYFHDNRAGSLEEVFTKHRHQLKRALPKAEVDALVAFLRSL